MESSFQQAPQDAMLDNKAQKHREGSPQVGRKKFFRFFLRFFLSSGFRGFSSQIGDAVAGKREQRRRKRAETREKERKKQREDFDNEAQKSKSRDDHETPGKSRKI